MCRFVHTDVNRFSQVILNIFSIVKYEEKKACIKSTKAALFISLELKTTKEIYRHFTIFYNTAESS